MVSQKGIEAVEDYLLGRYHMYKGVYYHKTIRCMENMLINTFKRASALSKERNKIADITKPVTPDMMLPLDDHTCNWAIRDWSKSSDKILSDLSKRLIDRKLLKTHQITKDEVIKTSLNKWSEIEKAFKKRKLNFEYYFIQDAKKESGYDPYAATNPDDEQTAISHIMINTKLGELKEISEVSSIVKAISREDRSSVRIFYPEELSHEMDKMLTGSLNTGNG